MPRFQSSIETSFDFFYGLHSFRLWQSKCCAFQSDITLFCHVRVYWFCGQCLAYIEHCIECINRTLLRDIVTANLSPLIGQSLPAMFQLANKLVCMDNAWTIIVYVNNLLWTESQTSCHTPVLHVSVDCTSSLYLMIPFKSDSAQPFQSTHTEIYWCLFFKLVLL